ncbi:MAG: glycosyltransferase family 39 protein [bacterium]|nr:glycosyltransferase family 39 protein [bacterium]
MSSPARYNYALLLITVLAAVIRLLTMQNMSVWFDEAVSLLIARNSVWQIVTGAPGVTVNPPLYYVLLHLWNQVAGGETGGRLLSILFGLAGVITVYLLALRLMGRKIALLTALIFAVSPFQVYYSQELRMYSLLTFFSLGIIYSTIGVLQRDRAADWVGLALFSLAGMYTHYFTAPVLAVSIGLILAIAYRRRGTVAKTAIVCIAVAVLFAPWVPSFMNNTGEIYTAKSANVTEVHSDIGLTLSLLGTLKSFSIGNEQTISFADYPRAYFIIVPACLLFTFLFIMGMTLGPHRKKAVQASMYIFIPIVMTILVSARMDVYLNRYLIICTGPFYLVVARGLSLLSGRRRLFTVLTALLVALSLAANFNRSLNPDYRREEFRQAALYVARNARPGDKVSHPSMFTLYPFLEYGGKITDEYLFIERDVSARIQGLIPYKTIIPTELAKGRIWWVMPVNTGKIQSKMPWYHLPQQDYSNSLEAIKQRGFEEVEQQDFRGIRVILLRKMEACI